MFASSGMIRSMTSSTYGNPFLKYCGWRLSTICCSTFQSCSTKGPVPSAALLRSPCRLIPASLMMKPQNPPRAARSPANGSFVTNFTAWRPAGSTRSTAMKSDLPGDRSKSRSNVNFTSADVSSWPSWNFTPWRSLNVQTRPSRLTSHDSASSGTGCMSASKRTSWLYIIGDRRLRENAGTSCGSSPVASVVWAETKVPPRFGACAYAGLPSESAARAAPPPLSRARRLSPVGSEPRWRVVIVVPPVARSLDVRIEDVAQAVADQIEREHARHDRDARKHRDPRRGLEIGPALVQHVPPGWHRRLGREAEVAQRGLDQDRLGERDRPLHDERRAHVGQDVLEPHGPACGAERAHRLDVVLLALRQDRASHHAREERRVDDRDRDDRAVHAGPAHRRDPHRQEEPRDAEEHVHHPVDDVVPRAAGVPGGEPEHAADPHGDADRDEGDVERDPRAVDDPAQDVTAEPVRPEERLPAGSRLHEVEVLLVGRMRRERVGEDRGDDDQEGEEPADDHHGAARDAPDLSGPLRLPGRQALGPASSPLTRRGHRRTRRSRRRRSAPRAASAGTSATRGPSAARPRAWRRHRRPARAPRAPPRRRAGPRRCRRGSGAAASRAGPPRAATRAASAAPPPRR